MRITKEPEVRKKEIIDVAMKLFEENGIMKTSMNDIAKEMDVAKGLLYYYFKSKDELITEVIESFSKDVDEEIKGIMKSEAFTFYEKLSLIIGKFFNSIAEHPAMMDLSPVNPGIFDYVKTKLSDVAIYHAKALLEEGEAKGILKIRYPEYVLRMLISGIADLYMDGINDPEILTVIIEQTLGLPLGKIDFKIWDGIMLMNSL